jgi:HTH-type transcriptional regulator/antitoxin HigA
MIEQVINQYQPESVSPPGDTLADLLEERGMSQAELAERMGRPTKTINEIIKGKAMITPETAIQLERVFGVPADFWNNRESLFRQYRARIDENIRLASHVGWVKKFPIQEMVKYGWLKGKRKDAIGQVGDLLSFFGVASPTQWRVGWTTHRLAFRRSSRSETLPEPASVWLRQGEIEAEKIKCTEYCEEKLRALLPELRALTCEADPKIFCPKLIELCAGAGVAVTFVPGLPGAPICGAARWISPQKALIQLSLRYKTDDHLWFTFFHELGHILLHKKKEIFVELTGKQQKDEVSDEEREADHFSAQLLIPDAILKEWFGRMRVFSRTTVCEFAQEMGVAPGIVVGRLQHLKKLPHTHLNDLRVRYAWGGLE